MNKTRVRFDVCGSHHTILSSLITFQQFVGYLYLVDAQMLQMNITAPHHERIIISFIRNHLFMNIHRIYQFSLLNFKKICCFFLLGFLVYFCAHKFQFSIIESMNFLHSTLIQSYELIKYYE